MIKNFFKFFKYISVLLYCSLLGFTLYQVFSRYVLGRPLGWTERVATVSFVYLVFVYCSIVIIERGLLKVKVLGKLLPISIDRKRILIIKLISIVTFAWMTIGGIRITYFARRQKDVILGISYSYIYFAIPLGFFLMLLATIYSLVKQIKENKMEVKID